MSKAKLLSEAILKLHPTSKFQPLSAQDWIDAFEEHKTKEEFKSEYGDLGIEIRKDIINIGWDIHTGVYNSKLYKALK